MRKTLTNLFLAGLLAALPLAVTAQPDEEQLAERTPPGVPLASRPAPA